MKASTALLFQKITVAVIMAVSLSLVVGFLGELSLGHAGFMSIGAYLGGKVALVLIESGDLKANNMLVFVIALIVGALCAALCGFIVGFAALRLRGDYLAIVTLAFGEIVRVIFTNTSSASFGGALGLQSPSFSKKQTFILVIIGLVLILLTLFVIQILLAELVERLTGGELTDLRLDLRFNNADLFFHIIIISFRNFHNKKAFRPKDRAKGKICFSAVPPEFPHMRTLVRPLTGSTEKDYCTFTLFAPKRTALFPLYMPLTADDGNSLDKDGGKRHSPSLHLLVPYNYNI